MTIIAKMNTTIIAEIGQAHDGSVGLLHSFIDALSEFEISAIKFQTHVAEAESSMFEPFRVNFSYVDKTRYDYWKRMEFSLEQWIEIKSHCENVGKEFISSPFSCNAVDILESIGVRKYKIGSGEITNHLMLEKIAKTLKPVILSSGMSTYKELDEALEIFIKYGNEISVLQCTSEYPVQPENIGLKSILELQSRYNIPTGLSDHSGSIFPSIAAIALGAKIIEVHVTFDKRMFGPDSKSSITIDDLELLVKGINLIERAMREEYSKNDISMFEKTKTIFGKSLCLNKNMESNSIVLFKDLESKKPGNMGIPAKDYKAFIGRKLKSSKINGIF